MKYYKPIFRFFRRPTKRIKLYFKQKAGWLGVPKVILFRGYGNEEEIFISGRVVEDSGLTKPHELQTIRQNILATIKRFTSDEIAGVKVKAKWNEHTKIAVTDEYGFFNFSFQTGKVKKSGFLKEWLPVHVELLDKVVENQPDISATEDIRIIYSKQKRIIVSDIDDTILISYSTQTIKKLRLMLFKNAHTRLPFNAIPDFYNALKKGKSGYDNNPFFFVSSSEWNLYDLLDDFFSHHNIPKGIFLLRKLNYSIYKFWKSGGGNHEHKYENIKTLMQLYPNQKFILIGDSGQSDPEIYKRLALEFPGMVEAIYIRKVKSKKTPKMAIFQNKQDDIITSFTEINDSNTAIKHARKEGFIT